MWRGVATRYRGSAPLRGLSHSGPLWDTSRVAARAASRPLPALRARTRSGDLRCPIRLGVGVETILAM